MNCGSRVLAGLLSALLLLGCRTERALENEPAPAATGPREAAEPPAPELAWGRPRVVAGPASDGAAPTIAVEVPRPRFAVGEGPRVAIDAGHHNYAIRPNYAVFAEALAADGFVVEFIDASFSAAALADVDVLLVVNALHLANVERWSLPTPSAFTDAEIAALAAWVEAGGGLWLVADHHPFPGAAAGLAARFGFALPNGFAFREPEPGRIERGLIGFSRADATIVGGHPITDGDDPRERIDRLLSFTGSAFEPPADARALFELPPDGVVLLPEVAWEFDEDTPRRPAGGWAVAAVREQGRGRVAMFGEAAMLSARYVEADGGWFGVGFVHPDATDNLQLVLNTARWLAG